MIQKAAEVYESNKSKRVPKFKAKDYGHSVGSYQVTMQVLESATRHFKSKYGFQCHQIAIHRDEGCCPKNAKGDPTSLVINHHTHFEFIALEKILERIGGTSQSKSIK